MGISVSLAELCCCAGIDRVRRRQQLRQFRRHLAPAAAKHAGFRLQRFLREREFLPHRSRRPDRSSRRPWPKRHAQNKPAVIAVVDRVGNVLGVYRMDGAPPTIQIRDPRTVVGGLEGLNVPPELGAISKADHRRLLFVRRQRVHLAHRRTGRAGTFRYRATRPRRPVRCSACRFPTCAAPTSTSASPAAPVRARTARRWVCRPIRAASRCTRQVCRSARSACPARNRSTRSTTTPRTKKSTWTR